MMAGLKALSEDLPLIRKKIENLSPTTPKAQKQLDKLTSLLHEGELTHHICTSLLPRFHELYQEFDEAPQTKPLIITKPNWNETTT